MLALFWFLNLGRTKQKSPAFFMTLHTEGVTGCVGKEKDLLQEETLVSDLLMTSTETYLPL